MKRSLISRILFTGTILTLILFLLTGCGAVKMSFTTAGSDTTIEAKNAEDGYQAESPSFPVGSGRAAVVRSSLEEGKLKIDFMQVTIFHNTDNSPDDIMYGDIAASVTVGPGAAEAVPLEAGDYVMQITVIGKTSGNVTVKVEKQ